MKKKITYAFGKDRVTTKPSELFGEAGVNPNGSGIQIEV